MERTNIQKNINELFGGEYDYIVPLYQRNFAWGEKEITRLLQDIYESYKARHPYFVGSITVLNRNCTSGQKLEVIDGQQRLTALTLILKVLGKDYLPHLMATRLEYDSRDEVTDFLHRLQHNTTLDEDSSEIIKTFHTATSTIKECVLDVENEETTINKLKKSAPSRLKSFAEYLANQVYFVLAEMPDDTDVATYFEIMNNSGAQLEKHEVLKAQILASARNSLTLDEMKSLAIVWDACSQVDVRIQAAIDADKRPLLFGDNFDSFIPDNITKLIGTSEDSATPPQTLVEIISNDTFKTQTKSTPKEEDNPDNTGEAIIDFPNFLMHVFRLCYNDAYKKKVGKDIPLNEKDLLDTYRELSSEIKPDTFIRQLLFYRIILDRYVIRTDSDSDTVKWVLKRPHKSSSSNHVWFGKTFDRKSTEDTDVNLSLTRMEDNVIKALSMLQVSYPQRKYKRFLYELLSKFRYGTIEYNIEWYLSELNSMILKYLDETIEEKGERLYALGTSTPRFLLNAIDYLMYLSDSDFNFEFKYYNSVEHHLPQSREKYGPKYDPRTIDSIGNLFLLSRRANSSLNHADPKTKVDKAFSQIDSLPPNRRTIYLRTIENGWKKEEIEQHESEIIELLNQRTILLRPEKPAALS